MASLDSWVRNKVYVIWFNLSQYARFRSFYLFSIIIIIFFNDNFNNFFYLKYQTSQ